MQCASYSGQCTVQYTVYFTQSTLHCVNCTVPSVEYRVYSVQCTVYSVQCTVYTVHCTLYSSTDPGFPIRCKLTALFVGELWTVGESEGFPTGLVYPKDSQIRIYPTETLKCSHA